MNPEPGQNFPVLNLPSAELRLREDKGMQQVFDPIRKRFVALTPEEWVRQHMLSFLMQQRSYPPHLLAVEASIRLHRLAKRCDILVYGKGLAPLMIIELKSPSVVLDQKVLDQVVRYNMRFGAPYLLISNGMRHYAIHLGQDGQGISLFSDIPHYTDLNR